MVGFDKPIDENPYDDFFKRYDFDDRMKEFEEK